MGAAEIIQVLQALDVKVLGMSAAEKKAEVRAQVGLPRDGDAGVGVGAGGKETNGAVKVEEKKVEKEKEKEKGGKTTVPKVAPGSTAEKKGKVGTGAVEGVSKPGTSAASMTGAAKVLAEQKVKAEQRKKEEEEKKA